MYGSEDTRVVHVSCSLTAHHSNSVGIVHCFKAQHPEEHTMKLYAPRKMLKEVVSDLKSLLEPGLLGHYTWMESVEVIAFVRDKKSGAQDVRNIFSIYIAEQGNMPPEPEQKFLSGPKSKRLSGLKDWNFRVSRRPISITRLIESLEDYSRDGKWVPFEGQLAVGELIASPAWFCPADARREVPLNRILKNNFWSGSHVLELKDHTKSMLQELAGMQSRWEELSTWIKGFLPLDLARVHDRIGDIVLQVPANALRVQFRKRSEGAMNLRVAWNPQVKPRPVTVECRVEQDGLICMQREDLPEGFLEWPLPPASGEMRFSVYDAEKKLLLDATPPLQVYAGSLALESRSKTLLAPRRFRALGPDGHLAHHEVRLWGSAPSQESTEGNLPPRIDWLARRELRAQMTQLVQSKRFLQYGVAQGEARSEQTRALRDIRELIQTVSQGAVYLWDPYLSANDILNTLAFCDETGTTLRALTAGKQADQKQSTAICPRCAAKTRLEQKPGPSIQEKWIDQQCQLLESAFPDPPRMRIEFRISSGDHRGFHDRFLIFPGLGRDRSRVWSLGASINHIGAQHCIVQEVAYPEPVLDAFSKFWEKSTDDENLIWRSYA